jgi:hypothetical protein
MISEDFFEPTIVRIGGAKVPLGVYDDFSQFRQRCKSLTKSAHYSSKANVIVCLNAREVVLCQITSHFVSP